MSTTILSEMQCKNYFVKKLHVEANEHLMKYDKHDSLDELKIDYKISKAENVLSFMIDVSIEINKGKYISDNKKYHIYINLVSMFEFPGDTPVENVKMILEPNGLAMSYSIARGIIGDVTASSLHGRYILPSVNFLKLIEQNHAKRKRNKRIR